MEERQVTTDEGTTVLEKPFFVIATQNPSYQTGTFPLPESQLDRFLMRIDIGYPSEQAERYLLEHGSTSRELQESPPILDPETLLQLQKNCRDITVGEPVIGYIQNILQASRANEHFIHGLSPRAGISILHASQAWAYTDGRDFVRPEDVSAILPAVVNHRLLLKKDQSTSNNAAAMILSQFEIPV